MPIDFELSAFAKFLVQGMTSNVGEARKLALEIGAKVIEKEAKHVIGTYLFDWPQLAPDTQAGRAR
jgi:hypothetical protein